MELIAAGGNDLKAAAKLELAANAGHRDAQFRIANALTAGMNGKRDLGAAGWDCAES